jgi:MSHA biogenesis protein MshP
MRHNAGFVLMMAIFLLVVLATAGIYLVKNFWMGQQISTNLFNEIRTHYAAVSGLEWGKYKALNGEICNTKDIIYGGERVAYISDLTQENIDVNVYCETYTYTEGSNTINVYEITSIAEANLSSKKDNGFQGAGYVKRQLRTQVTNAS